MEQKLFDWKKIVLASLVGGVLMAFVAGAWHTLLATAFYKENVHASHDGTGIIFIAYILLALMMSVLWSAVRGSFNGRWAPVLFGAFMGVLWVFPHELVMVGAHGKLEIPYVLRNAAWHVVEQGFGGWVMGLILTSRVGIFQSQNTLK